MGISEGLSFLLPGLCWDGSRGTKSLKGDEDPYYFEKDCRLIGMRFMLKDGFSSFERYLNL